MASLLKSASIMRTLNATEPRVVLYGCVRGYARLVHAGHLTAPQAFDELTTAADRAGWPASKGTPAAIRDGLAAEGITL